MRSNTSLLGTNLLWIALQARIFGAVRAENKIQKFILCRVATKITYGVNLNENL